MAQKIRIKKGLDLNLKGKAPRTLLDSFGQSSTYALVPDDFTGVIPKLAVRVGDQVQAGDSLMFHKRYPELKLTSPVSGEVVAINRGAKRKILSVEVRPTQTIEYKQFDVEKAKHDDAELKNILLDSGLFALIKQRPFDIIAEPNQTPRDIFVTARLSAPLAPEMEFLLEGQEAYYAEGLRALTRLTSGKVYVGKAANSSIAEVAGTETYEMVGPHPAGNVGVLINRVAPVNKGEMVWTLKASDVVIIGRFLSTGQVDYTRRVALTGSDAQQLGYVNLLTGSRVAEQAQLSRTGTHARVIAGDPLTGVIVNDERPFLPLNSDQITVIPEGDQTDEVLGWALPRFNQYSRSRTYFSWLMPKKEYAIDTRVKGGERAMIMSSEITSVFPMDIYPEYLLKAIIAFDIDKMEQLGVYEVAPEDFALSEFVDTSKMELQYIVRQGLDMLYKELN